jgi:hypothetical protein
MTYSAGDGAEDDAEGVAVAAEESSFGAAGAEDLPSRISIRSMAAVSPSAYFPSRNDGAI